MNTSGIILILVDLIHEDLGLAFGLLGLFEEAVELLVELGDSELGKWVLRFEVGDFGLEHVDLVVFGLDFGLEAGVVLLQFEELLGLDATRAAFFGEALYFCTQNNNLERKLIGELSLFFKFLLHGLVVAFIALNIPDQSHDMILA
jgi:hypothetical protein